MRLGRPSSPWHHSYVRATHPQTRSNRNSWWLTDEWLVSTGVMFIVGAISVGLGVGFSSYYHHLILSYTQNVGFNATVAEVRCHGPA